MYKLSYIIFLRVSLGFYSFDSRFKPYKSNSPFESRRANPRACERAGKIIAKIKNTLFSPPPPENNRIIAKIVEKSQIVVLM